MCCVEEFEGFEERAPVLVRVIRGEREEATFFIKPRLRKKDLRRSKRILRENLNLALSSSR